MPMINFDICRANNWWLGVKLAWTLMLPGIDTVAAEPDLPPPTLWLSANRQVAVEIGQGWPLRMAVQVLNEELMLHPGTEQAQLIMPPTTNWTDAVAVQVISPSGTAVELAMQPDNQLRGALRLTCDSGAQTGWWIAPEATSTLEPGLYQLQVILNTTNSVEGWSGIAKSQVIEVTVRGGSTPWSDDSAAESAFWQAEYRVWQGDIPGAIALLDSLLTQQPTLIPVLSRRAELLLASGAEKEALTAYEHALEQFLVLSADTETEPPYRLLRNRKALLEKALFAPPRTFVPIQAQVTNDRHIALQWSGEAGKIYEIESSSDLMSWTTQAGPIAGADELQVWTTPLAGAVQFFRIQASP